MAAHCGFSRCPTECFGAVNKKCDYWRERVRPYRIPYADAVTRRPAGACYCDNDDRTCYHLGHWEPVEFPDNGPGESF